MNQILPKIIIFLIFTLAGVLFLQNLTSINVDIGRHIKLGEIIWQTKEVPKTNLLSFTAPDFPFINHHWLSEVIFYGIFSLGGGWLNGLKLLIIFKMIVLLAAYFLLFLIVRKHNIFSVVLAFIISISIFAARTEPRPEIFSYLIFAAYLLIIYRARELPTSQVGTVDNRLAMSVIWFLPVLQLFWVNLHIYFAIGPIVYFLFLIERVVLKKLTKQEVLIGALILLANLANPNFYEGAIYPLKVLSNYGYSVAENSSLFFLAKYFGRWSPQDKIFLASLFVLAGSFLSYFYLWITDLRSRLSTGGIRWFKVFRTRTFDLLLVAMTATLSFKMQRNIPLYALSLWPVMSENLSYLFGTGREKLLKRLYVGAIFLLAIGIYFVASGRFYRWLDSAKTFGLEVSSAAQDGTEFLRANKIQGPMFNNFDIGSYLVWQLFPDQKVFVDGRPEAYPVEFFETIYKPMQRDEKIWLEMSEQYGINYIFFAHTDVTEWADEFLIRINKDDKWPMVFLNDAVVVFLKNNDANRSIIDKYKITEQNIEDKIPQVLDRLNKKDDNAFINFGNILYRFRWLGASARVYEALIANQPNNPYGYQGAAYAYITMNDPATQEKAGQNLKKAIDLGFQTFNNYFTLGIVNANLDNLFTAEENFKKALEINPDSQNARRALEIVRNKLGQH